MSKARSSKGNSGKAPTTTQLKKISRDHSDKVAQGLCRILANTFTLYLKTHYFHWNIRGPQFASLHILFEQQYTELWQATDVLAERIKALGYEAPGTYQQFEALSEVKNLPGIPSQNDMVRILAEDNETTANVCYEIKDIAEELDQPSQDLINSRIQIHEKVIWMLRSSLEQK
ncbi:Dps family protein [soil metagenome]